MAVTRKFLSFETVSLIVAFAILSAAGYVTIRTEANRRDSGAWVRHTLRVEAALHRLDGTIRRAESEERGYIITHDPAFYPSKPNLEERVANDLKELGALIADNPEQTERLDRLKPILRQRLTLLQQKLDLVQQGRFDEAAAIVRAGRGKALMDQIDGLVTEMVAEEESLHQRRDEELDRATDTLQTAIGVLMSVIAAVGGFAIFLAEKQMNALRKSSDSLRQAYDQLVEESTRRASLEAQLRQSQKLEALGQLTGGIAHDFNNMLGVVVASLNILRRKLERHEEGADKLIDSALEGTERAANLVHRLLAFSRVQPLHPKPINANDLVVGMSTILQRTLGGNVQLSTALEKDLWRTRADANELENAILNLAVNARDAMPGGGRLTIETRNVELDEAYVQAHPDVRPGRYVMVAVCDTGRGMPPEVVDKAFDPFFTTKPVGKGTGLGLSQVHGFVRQSGGHVEIVSEVGRGATIKLYLPIYVKGQQPPAPPAIEPKPDAMPRGTPEEVVLVVDDDETARRVTAQGVRELGYTVLESDNGKDALQIIRARVDVSLLVTDVVMPEMDGARLAREAVFRRHSLHVLFVTGYSSSAAMPNGILDPAANLLTKPFSLAQLARKIREVLDARANLPEGRGARR